MIDARRRRSAGQALPIMVLIMAFVIVPLVAVVVDAGNTFAHQRDTQNGTDASALGGATVLAHRAACFGLQNPCPQPGGGWDSAVLAAVLQNAAANGITITAAYYTDRCGVPIRPSGVVASDLSVAARVGNGIPADNGRSNCATASTAAAPRGVLALGQSVVPSYIAGFIGITEFEVNTEATAVAADCEALQGCPVLPIAIPLNITTCDAQGKTINSGVPWDYDTLYRVPLCQNNPGSVGWVDWTPPSGGSSELEGAVRAPNNSTNFPSWQASQSGNTNMAALEDALRAFNGQQVRLMTYDVTCSPPGQSVPNSSSEWINDPARDYGCPGGGLNGGSGNPWYRVPGFIGFRLCGGGWNDQDCADAGAFHGAYVSGNRPLDAFVCDPAGGNGSTSCLVGKFELLPDIVGTIGTQVLIVQLIK